MVSCDIASNYLDNVSSDFIFLSIWISYLQVSKISKFESFYISKELKMIIKPRFQAILTEIKILRDAVSRIRQELNLTI